MINYINYALAYLPDSSQLLPATALVAIIIFLGKELLEWLRRRAADARKVRALKKVLARECQLNYSAIGRMRDALTTMQESGITVDAARLSLSKSAAGGYVYMITDHRGSGAGGMLVGIQRDTFLKYLVEIAGLDEGLYLKCETALDGLSEADHVYQSLVHGPEKHYPSTLENYYDGLIDYGVRELNDSIAGLEELYLVCTGSVLQEGKLR